MAATNAGIVQFKPEDVPPGLLRQIQEQARTSIEPYSVSFVRDQMGCGSGTLVHAFGAYGILTADHVAKNLFGRIDAPLGIVVTREPAATFLRQEQLDIIELGAPGPEAGYTEHGPDLAFVRILDPDFLSTMKAKRSFVPLERGVLEGYEFAFSSELHPSPWIISGAPVTFEGHTGERGTGKHVLMATHFTGDAEFVSISQREEFDLIRLRVNSGMHGFPANYEGLSGGGLWLAPFGVDPSVGLSSIQLVPPQLLGVVFYQFNPEMGTRELVAHGPRSVYVMALSGLKKRFG